MGTYSASSATMILGVWDYGYCATGAWGGARDRRLCAAIVSKMVILRGNPLVEQAVFSVISDAFFFARERDPLGR